MASEPGVQAYGEDTWLKLDPLAAWIPFKTPSMHAMLTTSPTAYLGAMKE